MTAKSNFLSPLSRPTLFRFLFLKHFVYSVLPITVYLKIFGFWASFFICLFFHKFLIWPRAPPIYKEKPFGLGTD
jgi:hypothetical protein